MYTINMRVSALNTAQQRACYGNTGMAWLPSRPSRLPCAATESKAPAELDVKGLMQQYNGLVSVKQPPQHGRNGSGSSNSSSTSGSRNSNHSSQSRSGKDMTSSGSNSRDSSRSKREPAKRPTGSPAAQLAKGGNRRASSPALPQYTTGADSASSNFSSKKNGDGGNKRYVLSNRSPSSSSSGGGSSSSSSSSSGGSSSSSGGGSSSSSSRVGRLLMDSRSRSKHQQAAEAGAVAEVAAAAGAAAAAAAINVKSSAGRASTGAYQKTLPAGSALPSNGKGFGSAPSSSSSNQTSGATILLQGDRGSSSSTSGSRVVKVCRYGVEAAALQRAIDACGWQGKVLQVEGLKQADVLLAVKTTAGGRHQNLTQGERAAANAGIPFVMVGRRLSKATLHQALATFVNPGSASDPARVAARAAQLQREAENKKFADAWFAAAAQWGKLTVPLAAGSGTAVAGTPAESRNQRARRLRPGKV